MDSTANSITLIFNNLGTDELDGDEDGNLQLSCRNKSLIGIYSKQQGEWRLTDKSFGVKWNRLLFKICEEHNIKVNKC